MKERTKKTMTNLHKYDKKLTVYIAAFVFEDLGQVLCQETLYCEAVLIYFSKTSFLSKFPEIFRGACVLVVLDELLKV